MSVIKFIHYKIPTVEKNNTKKKYRLKPCKNALRKFFFGRSHGTTRKILVFPLFFKFCSKKAVLPPPTTFFFVSGAVHPEWASFAAV
jgi:hypothetical protein